MARRERRVRPSRSEAGAAAHPPEVGAAFRPGRASHLVRETRDPTRRPRALHHAVLTGAAIRVGAARVAFAGERIVAPDAGRPRVAVARAELAVRAVAIFEARIAGARHTSA